MANKHTPGPWTIQPVDKRCGPDINITGPDPYANVRGDHSYRYYVAIVKATDRDDTTAATAGGWVYPRVAQAQANARLISAAPDLLDACLAVKAFLDKLEDGCDEDDPLKELRRAVHKPLWDKLRPAIDKALGGYHG